MNPMHIIRTLSLTGLLLLPTFAGAADVQRLQATPRVTAVTVFADRAMTSRTATVKVARGSYLVTLEPLPALMQDDSIRVEGKGSARATIVGMEVKRKFVPQVPEKRAAEIEEEIRSLQRKLGSLDARTSSLAAQKGFIESIRVAWSDRISKELAVGKPTAAELNEALSFVGNGITTVEEKAKEAGAEKAQLMSRIDALRRELEVVRGSTARESKSVEVNLEVAHDGELTLEVSGMLPQAGWEPSYDARLSPDGRNTELVFRGEVLQQTGEDWNNVDLSLSTARPSVGGTPPELFPWRVSFFRPMPAMRPMAPAKRSKSAPEEDAAVLEMAPMAAAPTPAAAGHLIAQVGEEQSSIVFHIPRPVDVPSDGTRHGSVVSIQKIPVSVEYLAVPKLSPYAYLRSELTNTTPYPLLPGKVNVFTGGNFTGSSFLKRVPSGEKFDLYFGVDDQVTVKREEVKSHKEAGLFGKNRQTYVYRIEAANFRKEPQVITLRDQLPVATDEEIKVSLEDPSRKPDEQKQDGTLTWKLRVEPGAKQVLSFGIAVEYPKDKEVSGL